MSNQQVKMADIDDMDDIENLLEAPYKNAEKAAYVAASLCELTTHPELENKKEEVSKHVSIIFYVLTKF